MLIDLIRHGLSQQNTGEQDVRQVGDHNVQLAEAGHRQAHLLGSGFGKERVKDSLWYCSPFCRTRQTHAEILTGAGVDRSEITVLEDPRLREVDHGYEDVDEQQALREIHGYFYYRFAGGEAPADCYDRLCSFIESLHRQIRRKKPKRVAIVCHGLTMRLFVMRWLHMTPEQFDLMANPHNCDVVTIGPINELVGDDGCLLAPDFACGRWGVVGLRWRAHK